MKTCTDCGQPMEPVAYSWRGITFPALRCEGCAWRFAFDRLGRAS